MPPRRSSTLDRVVDRTAAELQLAIAARIDELVGAALATVRDVAAALDGSRSDIPSHVTGDPLIDRLVAEQQRMPEVVVSVAQQRALSRRETQLLAAAIFGVPRRRFAELFGVTDNTIKTQLRSLLEKVGQPTLDAAVWWLRRRADKRR